MTILPPTYPRIDGPRVPLEDVGEHVPLAAPPVLVALPIVLPNGDTIIFPREASGKIVRVRRDHQVLPIEDEPLDVRYLDGRRWRLLEPFDFASETLERIIRVPAGFETDFASIPRVLWPIFPPTGPYGKAALVHDDLYQTVGLCSRGDADRTLLEAMVALQVNRLTRWTIYAGVRAGGARSYKGGL